MQSCLEAFLDNDNYPSALPAILEYYSRETVKPGLAASNAFILVEWGSILLSGAWEKSDPHLCLSFARVLELCLFSGKGTVKRSAIVLARRVVRRLLGDEVRIPAVIRQLTAKDQPLGSRTAVLLGVIAGVCARKNKTVLPKDQYYAFYVREILGSRTAIPSHIASALNDFFENFATAAELSKEVIPTLEKALLRAPELVQDLVQAMVHSLPPEVDLAEILADHLLKPLLANTRSQTATIRDGAASAFVALMSHAQEEKSREKIADDLVASYPKLTVVEQRLVQARMLAHLPYISSKSVAICRVIVKLAGKEPNETALAAVVSALKTQYAQVVLRSASENFEKENAKEVEEVFIKGLNDKKPVVRRIWALSAGDLVWKEVVGGSHHALERAFEAAPAIVSFVESIAPSLLQIFEEVAQGPIVAGPLFTAAFTITALFPIMLQIVGSNAIRNSLRKAKIYDRSLSQASFLLNHRVYTKLSSHEDLSWVIRALVACSNDLEKASPNIKDAWTQTLLYLIAATGIPPTVRNEAMTSLTNAWSQRSRMISEMVIQGLWKWQRQTELSEKDSTAPWGKSGTSQLFLAVRSICPPGRDTKQQDRDSMQTQLIHMLVLCRPEVLPRVHWIDTCLRMGQDPGTIARTNFTECLRMVDHSLTPSEGPEPSATVKLAAYNTAAELAFVAPDTITPALVGIINNNLPTDELKQYGPTEIAIARTQEGTAFVDVSSKVPSYTIDKNAKDYDTMKWEEEIRSQVAQKRGRDRKLTPDEKAKVQVQLTKEAVIRRDVHGLESRLRNGLGFVRALAIGPPIDPGLWLSQALQALVNVIAAGAGRLVGPAADETYLECSRFVSSRLGSLRPFIGIATLRALGSSTLPKRLMEEPLGDLVTRLLYRLRFASEQRPFDSITLIYVLPLVFAVLQQSGIARPAGDEADEQITLALEILSFHTDACKYPTFAYGPIFYALGRDRLRTLLFVFSFY